jgi:P27 family predicted phage terminase small subunit
MLEGACVSYQSYADLHEIIEKQGVLVAKKEPNPVTGQLEVVDVRPHPGIHVRDRALMQMKAFCSEFGLSPISRIRLAVERRDSSQDNLLTLLSKPRASKNPSTEVVP